MKINRDRPIKYLILKKIFTFLESFFEYRIKSEKLSWCFENKKWDLMDEYCGPSSTAEWLAEQTGFWNTYGMAQISEYRGIIKTKKGIYRKI